MKWRNKKPTKPGWYWWRHVGYEARIVNVYVNESRKLSASGEHLDFDLDNENGDWSGRLAEPTDGR